MRSPRCRVCAVPFDGATAVSFASAEEPRDDLVGAVVRRREHLADDGRGVARRRDDDAVVSP
jgi:hypothetical protein